MSRRLLDFPSEDILAANINHVLTAAGDVEMASLIEIPQISGQKETVIGETVIGETVIADGHKITAEHVATKYRIALDGDFSDLARFNRFIPQVDDAKLQPGQHSEPLNRWRSCLPFERDMACRFRHAISLNKVAAEELCGLLDQSSIGSRPTGENPAKCLKVVLCDVFGRTH